jgi:hypothetical protein
MEVLIQIMGNHLRTKEMQSRNLQEISVGACQESSTDGTRLLLLAPASGLVS